MDLLYADTLSSHTLNSPPLKDRDSLVTLLTTLSPEDVPVNQHIRLLELLQHLGLSQQRDLLLSSLSLTNSPSRL